MKYQAPYGSTDPDASYVDRNTPGAVAGSKVPAAAIEHPQREITSVITKSDLAASDGDLMQLAKAVRSLRLNHVPATLAGSALTVTLDPAPARYDDLRVLWVVPGAANAAGAMTININGLGPVPVTVDGGDPPAAAFKAAVPAMLARTATGYALIGASISNLATLAEALAGVDAVKLITSFTLAGAVQRGQWTHGASTGTGNALVVTLSPAPTAYDNLKVVWVVPNAANVAGAVSININGLGAVPVTVAGAAPPPGALKAGVPAMLVRTAGGYALIGFDAAGGRLLRTRVYTLVGGTQYVQVDGGAPTTSGATSASPLDQSVWAESEVQGGGGGGSGCPATDSASQSAAGGGGSGAWAIKRTTAAALSGATVTVGAGGAGGAAGPNAGANGGTSSVGAIVSAPGGSGGLPAGPIGTGNFVALPGGGGVAGTSGDINLPGVHGAAGAVAGGQGVPLPAAPGRILGGYYGSGGGSNASSTSTAAKVGNAGVPGIVIIREYA